MGSGLVWGPMAIYLMATGSVGKGVLLLAYGVGVIGLVDNIMRPLLVGKDTRMPDYLVLISTIGGMSLFGLNGFVGPVRVPGKGAGADGRGCGRGGCRCQ